MVSAHDVLAVEVDPTMVCMLGPSECDGETRSAPCYKSVSVEVPAVDVDKSVDHVAMA